MQHLKMLKKHFRQQRKWLHTSLKIISGECYILYFMLERIQSLVFYKEILIYFIICDSKLIAIWFIWGWSRQLHFVSCAVRLYKKALFTAKETINGESETRIRPSCSILLWSWMYLKKAWASMLLFILLEHMTATFKLLVAGILHQRDIAYKP
jgi:hypothetical protein